MDNQSTYRASLLLATALLMGLPAGVFAQGVPFDNITPSTAITYARAPSVRHANVVQFRQESLSRPVTLFDVPARPMRSRRLPGVALLDYDNDGDLDIYVTNGPGSPNSLLSSQYEETSQLTFADVAATAGVTVTAHNRKRT